MKYKSVTRQPLHQQVEHNLREHITQHLKPGMRLEPEVQLAEQFDVSVKTIREALTTFAHEGLIERRAGRGTIVRERPTPVQHVALILGVHPAYPRTTYFSYRMNEMLNLLLGEASYRVHTYWPRYQTEDPCFVEFCENMARDRIGGVIILCGPLDQRWREVLAKSRAPIVGGESTYGMVMDRVQLIEEGVRCLLLAGRRKLALLSWADTNLYGGRNITADAKCFRFALAQNGVVARETWIRTDLHPTLAGAGYEEFKEMWMSASEKPDGLLVCDDVLFPDAAKAILETGIRVPDQLMVVSQTTKGSGMLYPFPMIRLEYDPEVCAQVSGTLLMQLMKGETVKAPKIDVPFQLVGAEAAGVEKEQTTTARSQDLATKGTQ